MKIIRQYILKELFAPWVISLLLLTFVMLMGNMIKLTDLMVNKGISIIDVTKLILCFLPYLLTYTIPMSSLIAVLITFGRFSSDNEITAIKASGVGLKKMLSPVLMMAFILSLFSIILNDKILPKAHFEQRKIIKSIVIKAPAAYLEAGTFIKDFANYIVFIYEIDGGILKDIRIYEPRDNGPARTIIAEKAEIVSTDDKQKLRLKLINGTSDEPNPRKPGSFYKLNFKSYSIVLELSEMFADTEISKKPSDMTIQEILHEITILNALQIDTKPLHTEFHKKISLAFATFFFVFLGFSLALITKRSEKSVAFALGLLVVLCYYILLAAGKTLALNGTVDPAISMWTPNALAFLAAIILFRKAVRC